MIIVLLVLTAMIFLIFCYVHFLSVIGPLVKDGKYYLLPLAKYPWS